MVVIALWTEPFLAYHTMNELPDDQTETRRIDDARRPTKFTNENYTRKVPPEYFKDVSPKKRDDSSWLKYTLVLVAITPQLGPL